MASSLSSSPSYSFSSIILYFIAIITIISSSPVSSTSRHTFTHDTKLHKGFKITLKHVDSGRNLTRLERLQRAMKRGRHRLHKLNVMAATSVGTGISGISSPVHVGSGEFLMRLSIGNPPEPYSAIMDTGSDLIWTQCKPCKECFEQSTPIFDPHKSSSFGRLSCSSPLCDAAPVASCIDGCQYVYSYGDYSSTQGVLASETFTFGEVSVPSLAFGCGYDNEGTGFTQAAGLVGLGRGPLSLVSQLEEPKFSYCLTSMDDTTSSSTLLMGSLAVSENSRDEILSTPMIKNPSQPTFYYLSLEGITVGKVRLPIDKTAFTIQSDGSGGMIIDSGTTLTYLEESVFELVKKEFISQVKLPVDDSGTTGLELCFLVPPEVEAMEVPRLIFHFYGGDIDFPGENYIIQDSGVICLGMGSSQGMSIFGNLQQQNLLVLHDLVKETVSFVGTRCDELW